MEDVIVADVSSGLGVVVGVAITFVVEVRGLPYHGLLILPGKHVAEEFV
jgi:hypothetical protein